MKPVLLGAYPGGSSPTSMTGFVSSRASRSALERRSTFDREGVEVHELENPSQVDAWRKEVGLLAIAAVLDRVRSNNPLPTQEEYEAKQVAGLLWGRKVGWIE